MKLSIPATLLVVLIGPSDLYAGTTEAFPATFELSSLDGESGLKLNGSTRGDLSGASVSSAGDFNGDGIDDLIIGATDADPNGITSGESYVVFGGQGIGSTRSFTLSELDGSNGFVLKGIGVGDRSGNSVACAGDVNGDSFDDLIIGAYRANPNGEDSGESYVVYGGPIVGESGVFELSSLNGVNGFVIRGIGEDDYCGWSVSSAGDVNGDGFDDVILGARNSDLESPEVSSYVGESYVVFGGVGTPGIVELSALDGSNGFALSKENAIVPLFNGTSVSDAGDINDDGFDDLIIGAHATHANGAFSGESYVVFGATDIGSSGAFDLANLDGSDGFVLKGIDAADFSGISIASAGDVNGDGANDLIIGASLAEPNGVESGESYVVFGGVGVGVGGVVNFSALDGTNGFVLNGVDALDRCGNSVSSAGDVNGDGYGDLIIGAWLADAGGPESGESYVVFGAPGVGATGVIELSELDGSTGFVLNGIDAGDQCGKSVSSAGDIDGDGVDDFVIGANRAGLTSSAERGESYVVFGRRSIDDPADLNGGGCVGSADLAILLSAWDTPDADLDGDGTTNSADLSILLAAWDGC